MMFERPEQGERALFTKIDFQEMLKLGLDGDTYFRSFIIKKNEHYSDYRELTIIGN
jgi:hypothetical protein